jgi:8-oxo-dGTP diphosphatase
MNDENKTESKNGKENERTMRVIAAGFIKKQGKLLIAKRSQKARLFPGQYELPGGKLEFGEDPKQALKREIMEEFEVRVKVHEPFHCFSWVSDDKMKQLVEIAFFAELDEDEKNIKLTEHEEIRWVTKGDLDGLDISEQERKTMIKGFEVMAAGH